MELCIVPQGTISRLPQNGLFTPNQTILPWKTSFHLKHSSINRTILGLQYYTNSSLKSTTSEATSSGASQHVKEESVGVKTMEDVHTIETNELGETERAKEEPSVDDQMQLFEFLDKLNVEAAEAWLHSWLATAVVGTIDSIPVLWVLLAHSGSAPVDLLFKKNRDELSAKIEEMKQQVLGSNDD